MNTLDIRRKIVFTANKGRKPKALLNYMLEADTDTCGKALDTDVESGVREHTFHLPLQTATATQHVHRRYILMAVSILYQCTGCKGPGIQQAKRKQQRRARLDILFKPQFNIVFFPTKITRRILAAWKKKNAAWQEDGEE